MTLSSLIERKRKESEESKSKRATMAAKKKAILWLLFLFVLGFLLGIAVAADDSSEKLQVTSAESYKYDGKEASKGMDPNEAVACNSAAQGRIPSGEYDKEIKDFFMLSVDEAWTLGIEIVGGAKTETRISLNNKMPIKKSQTFSTYQDNQTSVSIKVYECEEWFRNNCRELGRFNLSGISLAPRGVPQIEVTFEVDEDKLLHVKAEDKSTRRSESTTITNCKPHIIHEEVLKMMKTYYEYVEQDKKFREMLKLVTYIDNMRNTIKDKDKLADKITSDDKEKVERTLEEALKWLDRDVYQTRTYEDYNEKLKEVEAVCNPVIERIYGKNNERSFKMNYMELGNF